MSIIVELSIAPEEFELGRILMLDRETSVTLETMVPLGERSVPFFRLHDGAGSFETAVGDHPAVDSVELVTEHGAESLYALDWSVREDEFLAAAMGADAHLLHATGTPDVWQFELRFPSRDCVSRFQEESVAAGIEFQIDRLFNPTRPDVGPWYGLTEPQRETLVHAVAEGYYAIPRRVSTKDLADELGISDQAVTERLRRAIETLARSTLVSVEEQS